MKIGFVGFGEVNSPRSLIETKCNEALDAIKSLGYEVVTTGIVTDDPKGLDAKRAVLEFKNAEISVLIICLAGWIPSHAVIAVTHEFRHHPMVLWGLAGDRKNGHITTAAAPAGTTALRKVFEDFGYKFRFIYNIVGQLPPLAKINNFIKAANASRLIENSKVGMMGFRDMKLYNTLYDGVSLKSNLGIDVEFFEMLEMVQLTKTLLGDDREEILEKIKSKWHFITPLEDHILEEGISYYLALKEIISRNGYQAISLKDVDGMKAIMKYPPALVFMLLSDELKVCTIPENDTMGAVTQLIIKSITGQCGAYVEFYEFFDSSLLVGVPDYVPAEVVQEQVMVTRAAFGNLSGGVLNVSKMRTGKITLARLSNTGDNYVMHMCTGRGELISWEEAGWEQPAPQLPSLEVFLDKPVEEFAERLSGQHYIIAYGDHTQAIKDFCYLKNIKVI